MVKKSVTTVLEMATEPSLINIAVAYDDDDNESKQYFSSNAWKLLVENTGATQEAHSIERIGWQGLHEYYNYLAQNIISDWYFIWNDDAFMRTQGWDQEILAHRDYKGLLSMESNGKRPDSTLFPCVSRLWVETFNMIGINPVDQWIQDITYPMNAYKRLQSTIFHDHFKTTGNNNDEVYQETSKTKKFTKRAYKTPEVSAMKAEWIERWKVSMDAN